MGRLPVLGLLLLGPALARKSRSGVGGRPYTPSPPPMAPGPAPAYPMPAPPLPYPGRWRSTPGGVGGACPGAVPGGKPPPGGKAAPPPKAPSPPDRPTVGALPLAFPASTPFTPMAAHLARTLEKEEKGLTEELLFLFPGLEKV